MIIIVVDWILQEADSEMDFGKGKVYQQIILGSISLGGRERILHREDELWDTPEPQTQVIRCEGLEVNLLSQLFCSLLKHPGLYTPASISYCFGLPRKGLTLWGGSAVETVPEGGADKGYCWHHFQHLGNRFFLEGQLDGTSSFPSQSSPCDPQIHFLKYFGGVAPTAFKAFKWASLSGVKVVNERHSQCQRWPWHCKYSSSPSSTT